MHLHILPRYYFFLDVLVLLDVLMLLGVLMLLDVLVLLDVGKEVEVCKEDEEGNCICTHRLGIKSKERNTKKEINFMRRTRGTILGYPQSKRRGRSAWKNTQTNWIICSLVRYLMCKYVLIERYCVFGIIV